MNRISEAIQSPLKFGNKLQDNIESNLAYHASNRFAKPENTEEEITNRQRLKWGVGSALFSAITSPLTQKYIFKNKKISIPVTLAETAFGFGTGYFTPDIGKLMRREKSGDISHEETREKIKSMEENATHASNKAEEIIDLYKGTFKEKSKDGFEKESGLIGGVSGLIGKTLKGTTGLLWKGVNPRVGLKSWQKTPFHRKALSFGVRGGVGVGALYGGYKGIQRMSGPRSGENYTTLLRNNVLAGNVKPGELSQEDLISVKKLGLR